ncbi:MAG: ferritin family protein [Chloroflexia bacterium]
MDQDLSDMTLQEAWELAIRREREAQALYRALAEKAADSGGRELFLFLLEQEEGHERRLQEEYDRAFRQEW